MVRVDTYKNIAVGATYRNFRGYERVVKGVHQLANGKTRITYDDFMGKYKTCYSETFIEWLRKSYY